MAHLSPPSPRLHGSTDAGGKVTGSSTSEASHANYDDRADRNADAHSSLASDGKQWPSPSDETGESHAMADIGAKRDVERSSSDQGPTKPSHKDGVYDGATAPYKRRRTISSVAGRARDNVPGFLKPKKGVARWVSKAGSFCMRHLNFYRIHLLVFTFTPLVFSAIFWASNTTPISYVDCLFVCISAMTVTGLTTINISTGTAWQQAILFFLMAIGNISAVSVTMIWIRRHFFRVKFDTIIRRSAKARKRINDVEYAHRKEKRKELIRLQRLVGLRRRHYRHDEDGEKDQHGENDGQYGFEVTPRSSASTDEIAEAELQAERVARKKERQRKKQQGPLRADMIRRMDQPAVLINPMGAISHTVHEREQQNNQESGINTGGILNVGNSGSGDSNAEQSEVPNIRIAEPPRSPSYLRRPSDPIEGNRSSSPERMTEDEENKLHSVASRTSRRRSIISFAGQPDGSGERVLDGPRSADAAQTRTRFEDDGNASAQDRRGSDPPVRGHVRHGSDVQAPRPNLRNEMFPRAQTIEFADPPHPTHSSYGGQIGTRSSALSPHSNDFTLRHRTPTTNEFERTPTYATGRSGQAMRRVGTTGVPMTRTQTTSMERGFGGFPTPLALVSAAIKKTLPQVQERFKRSTTVPRTATFASTHSIGGLGLDGQPVRSAPYLSFDATVSRNSRFHQLTEAQRDELGGVEYRAIDMLAKLIPLYWFTLNFFCVVLVAPWLASRAAAQTHRVLAEQGANAPNTTWFWFFQVISAYSNTGLSLIDTSMTELNNQYLMLIPMAFLILAGNTAFPILLRFFIWLLSLVMPKTSRTYETLRFLLDHPRRCFVYLFPSAQTWFLFAVLIVLNGFDWIMFQILDLGNATIGSWSLGTRIFDGLFQSIAVRAAGFQIISLLQLAPAVQFLYIIMMYISAYPVAMSVRNTNVYEERSLGIFNDAGPGEEDEPAQGGPRVWGTYLAAHARRQLAFDMWWLGFALWLVCIIERENIQDPDSNGWFTVFSCLFELTSAYGTVGLSTGTPTDDFSLSGRFHTLSKLVVIAVMLRGRHRGLPVAIDRAVLLPNDLEVEDDAQEAAYTIDEDGMIRTRSTYITEGMDGNPDGHPLTASTSTYFPRTGTNASMNQQAHAAQTPRSQSGMLRMSRERSVPVLDLDSYNEKDIVDGRVDVLSEDDKAFAYVSSHHPLTSIREAASTPLPSPSIHEMTRLKTLGASNTTTQTQQRDSNASSSAGSSEKGKATMREQQGGIDSPLSQDDREEELARKYGSTTESEARTGRPGSQQE